MPPVLLPSRRALLRLIFAGVLMPAVVAGVGCASRRQPADVQSVEWVLAEIDGFQPPLSRRPTATFESGGAGGRVFGQAYVNRYSAKCVLGADGTIWVDAITTTKMPGPAEWLEDERRYLARLRSAKAWRLKRDTLTLTAAKGESLVFTKP